MAPSFTDADIELMVAIFNQIGDAKIDNKRLQRDLNIQGASTTSVRLSRFRAKLAKASAEKDGSPSKVEKSPKKRPADTNGNDQGTPRKAGRKARVAYKEVEEAEEDEIDLVDTGTDKD